jgi:hypothetical protein
MNKIKRTLRYRHTGRDRVVESVCPTYSPDSLKTHLLRQTLEDHDELTTTGESQKDDQDDDATAEKSR